MDFINKKTQEALAKALEDITSANKPLAGGLFMQAPYMPASISDHLRGTFSSEKLIAVIAEEIEEWKQKTPEGKHLVLHFRTPTGEIMDVGLVKPIGWQGFLAEGNVKGLPCMVTGHISTLLLFCTYEETKGKSRMGFTIITDTFNEPQPESSQTAPDSK